MLQFFFPALSGTNVTTLAVKLSFSSSNGVALKEALVAVTPFPDYFSLESCTFH